jgi:hypothetical protein
MCLGELVKYSHSILFLTQSDIRVDYQGNSSGPRYGRCHTIYNMQLEGEHAIQMEHYENGML